MVTDPVVNVSPESSTIEPPVGRGGVVTLDEKLVVPFPILLVGTRTA